MFSQIFILEINGEGDGEKHLAIEFLRDNLQGDRLKQMQASAEATLKYYDAEETPEEKKQINEFISSKVEHFTDNYQYKVKLSHATRNTINAFHLLVLQRLLIEGKMALGDFKIRHAMYASANWIIPYKYQLPLECLDLSKVQPKGWTFLHPKENTTGSLQNNVYDGSDPGPKVDAYGR